MSLYDTRQSLIDAAGESAVTAISVYKLTRHRQCLIVSIHYRSLHTWTMAFPHPVNFIPVPRRETSETARDGYKRLKDVYIPTRDGSELCCNIYLPTNSTARSFPVLLTIGPYGKDVHFSEFGKPQTDMYASMAKAITPLGPDACFETPDPIVWASRMMLHNNCKG